MFHSVYQCESHSKVVEMYPILKGLRQQVSALAVAGASKILAKSVDEAAHSELLDQLANEL